MKQAAHVRRFQPDSDLVAIATARPGTTEKHDPAHANASIYTIPSSICSQRVRMTLLEKGVPYLEHVVNIAASEHLTPAYIALNPRALVPTMTFDDRTIFDSATIMRFANNWFTGPELAPADPDAFATMNRWVDRADDFPLRGFNYRVHLASGLPDRWRAFMHDGILRARESYPQHSDIYDLKLQDWHDLAAWMENPGDTQEGLAIAEKMADDAEAALMANAFLVGDTISLADITVLMLFMHLQCGCDISLWGPAVRPRLHRWVEALKSRPSYQGGVIDPYLTSGPAQVPGGCWLPVARAA